VPQGQRISMLFVLPMKMIINYSLNLQGNEDISPEESIPPQGV
jgi:hypothetical protein